MPVARPLDRHAEALLMTRFHKGSPVRARALALAAIRETCEETGVVLGRRTEAEPQIPSEDWRHFAQARVVPDLGSVRFIARAITPPRRPRRFDARFFVADATTIVHRLEGVVGPDSEFVEVAWVPLSQARSFDLPTITQIVLEELQRRIAEGLDRDRPVPFYHTKQGKFMRELL
jgi:8-oxo-dGTP pyrophosphatase MutT (NUDIX family)